MLQTYNVYTLEDNHKYIELDRIKENNTVYLFLSSEENEENILIRKIVDDDGIPRVLYLNEFEEILKKFTEKNKELFS